MTAGPVRCGAFATESDNLSSPWEAKILFPKVVLCLPHLSHMCVSMDIQDVKERRDCASVFENSQLFDYLKILKYFTISLTYAGFA